MYYTNNMTNIFLLYIDTVIDKHLNLKYKIVFFI
jgi:hypothetical protein